MDCETEDLLLHGERAIDGAPVVTLDTGNACVPQHYLIFDHSLDTVRALLQRITFCDKFRLYASEDGECLYLQVEIISHENYERSSEVRPAKKVYGRKWRVERNLPTSEIIQTAFLALQKAREHEVRELLTLRQPHSSKTSTALSNHLDLPLICREHAVLGVTAHETTPEALEDFVTRLQFNGQDFIIEGISQHNDQWLIDICMSDLPTSRKAEGSFAEYAHHKFTLLLKTLKTATFMYALMDHLLSFANSTVEEHFKYDGVARFSRTLDPEKLANLSIDTRNPAYIKQNEALKEKLKQMNFEVDCTRVPTCLKLSDEQGGLAGVET